MKKIIKISCLLLVFLFIVCACKNEDEVVDEPPVEKETNNLEKKITTNEVRLFNGEFNDRTVVLKVQNENDKPVYLHYSFEMYDKNKTKLYNKEVYIRVGKKDSAYVVSAQDLEEPSFDSYSYQMNVLDDELLDYDLIKSNIKISYQDNKKNLIVTVNNVGKKTTTAYGLLLFYKNGSLVAVKDVISYNIIPYKIDNIEVDYPILKVNQRISYDRIELVVNEVSTEL